MTELSVLLANAANQLLQRRNSNNGDENCPPDNHTPECQRPVSTQGLAIGLGLGIPVLLAALGLAYFHFKNVRKQKREEELEKDLDVDMDDYMDPSHHGIPQVRYSTYAPPPPVHPFGGMDEKASTRGSMESSRENPFQGGVPVVPYLNPGLAYSKGSLHEYTKTLHSMVDTQVYPSNVSIYSVSAPSLKSPRYPQFPRSQSSTSLRDADQISISQHSHHHQNEKTRPTSTLSSVSYMSGQTSDAHQNSHTVSPPSSALSDSSGHDPVVGNRAEFAEQPECVGDLESPSRNAHGSFSIEQSQDSLDDRRPFVVGDKDEEGEHKDDDIRDDVSYGETPHLGRSDSKHFERVKSIYREYLPESVENSPEQRRHSAEFRPDEKDMHDASPSIPDRHAGHDMNEYEDARHEGGVVENIDGETKDSVYSYEKEDHEHKTESVYHEGEYGNGDYGQEEGLGQEGEQSHEIQYHEGPHHQEQYVHEEQHNYEVHQSCQRLYSYEAQHSHEGHYEGHYDEDVSGHEGKESGKQEHDNHTDYQTYCKPNGYAQHCEDEYQNAYVHQDAHGYHQSEASYHQDCIGQNDQYSQDNPYYQQPYRQHDYQKQPSSYGRTQLYNSQYDQNLPYRQSRGHSQIQSFQNTPSSSPKNTNNFASRTSSPAMYRSPRPGRTSRQASQPQSPVPSAQLPDVVSTLPSAHNLGDTDSPLAFAPQKRHRVAVSPLPTHESFYQSETDPRERVMSPHALRQSVVLTSDFIVPKKRYGGPNQVMDVSHAARPYSQLVPDTQSEQDMLRPHMDMR